ncbi:VOC family protein [Streptomyces prasinus]|uniref:VOC family protein n=1 Tax=Streptomyces prasinus TaxID=67345 RepID=A0ABX6ATB8_9ACTN|nr:VOC family protein [Streptomyces prasinus]QEV05007.1 VOC family protein [Streptomyces prasinus]
MLRAESNEQSSPEKKGVLPPQLSGGIHHVGIQTADMESSIAWYSEFFGCTATWTMDGGFSALSHSRLPGISKLTELVVADVRLHLMTCGGGPHEPPPATANRFQHICIAVSSPEELLQWRAHWFSLFESGRYHFATPEPASEIDVDADGMCSFYAYDPNGCEFEFSYFPEHQ